MQWSAHIWNRCSLVQSEFLVGRNRCLHTHLLNINIKGDWRARGAHQFATYLKVLIFNNFDRKVLMPLCFWGWGGVWLQLWELLWSDNFELVRDLAVMVRVEGTRGFRVWGMTVKLRRKKKSALTNEPLGRRLEQNKIMKNRMKTLETQTTFNLN